MRATGTLTQQDTDKYAELWASLPAYGIHAPGLDVLPVFQKMAPPPASVLDAGAGSGQASAALAASGYDVTMCDLTDAGLCDDAKPLPFYTACLWKPLRSQIRKGSVDYVYCVDVLEHIPPQFTMLAIDQMLTIATKGVFLGIALVPDQFGVWMGTPLHLTVQPFTWWRDSLKELGTVVDARDLLHRGLYMVTR